TTSYVNALVAVADPLTRRFTVTSTVAGVCAGVVQVMVVVLITVTLAHMVPPTVTVDPALKFTPVMLITVPPAVGPELGFTAVTWTVVVPTLAKNASMPPRLVLWMEVPLSGKSVDDVSPVAYAFPEPSTANPRPKSPPDPPR